MSGMRPGFGEGLRVATCDTSSVCSAWLWQVQAWPESPGEHVYLALLLLVVGQPHSLE